MSRYYFDIGDGDGLHRDEFGDEFATLEEAVAQCQALLPDIMREEMRDGDVHTVTCDVRDERGCLIYRGEVTFRGMRGSI